MEFRPHANQLAWRKGGDQGSPKGLVLDDLIFFCKDLGFYVICFHHSKCYLNLKLLNVI